LNGPNLDLLGERDPAVYGSATLADLEEMCRAWGAELDVEIAAAQSNHEGALIDMLHDARGEFDGVVFNPGAYTHTSYALHDAIDAIGLPTVEVHISNVAEREEWRRVSVVRPACVHTIYGRGIDGYRWAIRHLFHRREWPAEIIRYAEHPDGFAEIRQPGLPGVHAAVVLVHGGFWRHMWARDTMDGIAVDLARRGYLTANVEYRRLGTGGGWPGTVRDVADAIDRVTGRDDVGPVAVIGHSAGGYLATIARTFVDRPFLPVSLGGVLDLTAAMAEGVGGDAPALFLGDGDASAASPVTAVTEGEVVAIHGVEDDRVPISQARAYAAVNPDCQIIELAGVGHFEFLERSDPAWLRVVEVLHDRLPARSVD
jgi:3-dehydroquinate dehydratase-2